MHSPKISVVIPIYNSDKYLCRCIDSMLVQSHADFELLLIDDGSTDCSGDICDRYAISDKRIRTFHKKNGGVSSARNVGIENAKGEFITFCDSDDFVDRDYLEKLLEFEGFDLMGVSMKSLSGESNWNLPDIICKNQPSVFDAMIKFSDDCFRRVAAKTFRMSIIQTYNIRFSDDIKWGEDALFVIDYLKYCNSIHFSSLAKYCYDLKEVGLTHNRTCIDELRLLEKFRIKIFNLNIGEYEKYSITRKFGYYHFECILKYSVFKNDNWSEIKNKLSSLIKESAVKVLISSKIKRKSIRTNFFDFLLRNGLLNAAIVYAKTLNSLGKSLY